jgi:hypothetical protein
MYLGVSPLGSQYRLPVMQTYGWQGKLQVFSGIKKAPYTDSSRIGKTKLLYNPVFLWLERIRYVYDTGEVVMHA